MEESKNYEELQRLQYLYEQGEPVDEDLMYELELLTRHRMGDSLTNDEQDDLKLICKERGYDYNDYVSQQQQQQRERERQEEQQDQEAEAEEEHGNQLPNVEEYKAQMGYKSSSSSSSSSKMGLPKILQSLRLPKKQDPFPKRMDPDGHYFDVQQDDDYEEDEEVIDFAQEEKNDGQGNTTTDGIFAPVLEEFTIDEEYLQEHCQTRRKRQLVATPKIGISSSWPFAKAIALVIISAVIVVSLIFAYVPNQSSKEYHWMHGETDEYLAIQDFVTKQRGISHTDVFDDTNSPQYLAAQWMAHGDHDMAYPVPTTADPTFEDRYVMAVLYFSLGGPQWENQVGFLSDGHICTWFEEFKVGNEEYEEDTVVYGLNGCNESEMTNNPDSYFPYILSLPSNGLIGTIPHEVQALYRLQVLNLEYNGGIKGTLPPGLWKMESLGQLILQWCNLKGTIPTWIGELTNLSYLGLGNNQLTGQVPAEIQKLTNLQLLGLDNNNLDGILDQFAPLINLKSLYLDHNYISGTLTDSIMASWPQLQELDLSDSLLMGSLPGNLFTASDDLRVIDLHANLVQGPLPPIPQFNEKLEFLALHENQLSGFIPESLTNLRNVHHLDLSINAFTSTIPEKLAELTNLSYLHIGINNFAQGTVPKFLIELTNLRELGLKRANLQGTIPEYIQYLSNLQFLDFHDNALTGTLPKGFGQLTEIRHLILKQNQLSGTIPDEFSRLTDLELLLMEQNNFDGDAQIICNSDDILVDTFVADCYTGFGSAAGDRATDEFGNFTCSCCSTCCSRDDPNCNDWEWRGNLDPVWEYGFRRQRYSYNLGPVIWTP
ncbi:unnamed protein product [Cylindrotheca closterium]|uniref:L domain-like protein n=1 Tax=Cylindrotheca closterium TaxID=2856 RepID=A0AAD2G0Z3_9STRA|nr:unnamed protein product [Cylindrotheca closterium]